MNIVGKVAQALRQACLKEYGIDWNNRVAVNFAKAAIEAMRQIVKFDPSGCQVDDEIVNGYIDRALNRPPSTFFENDDNVVKIK